MVACAFAPSLLLLEPCPPDVPEIVEGTWFSEPSCASAVNSTLPPRPPSPPSGRLIHLRKGKCRQKKIN